MIKYIYYIIDILCTYYKLIFQILVFTFLGPLTFNLGTNIGTKYPNIIKLPQIQSTTPYPKLPHLSHVPTELTQSFITTENGKDTAILRHKKTVVPSKQNIINVEFSSNATSNAVLYQNNTRFNINKPLDLRQYKITPCYNNNQTYYQVSNKDGTKIALINTKYLKYVNGYPLLRIKANTSLYKPSAKYTDKLFNASYKIQNNDADWAQFYNTHDQIISKSNSYNNVITGFKVYPNAIFAIPNYFKNVKDDAQLQYALANTDVLTMLPQYLNRSNLTFTQKQQLFSTDLLKSTGCTDDSTDQDALRKNIKVKNKAYSINDTLSFTYYSKIDRISPNIGYISQNNHERNGYAYNIYHTLNNADTSVTSLFNALSAKDSITNDVFYNPNELHLQHNLVGVYDTQTDQNVTVDTIVTKNGNQININNPVNDIEGSQFNVYYKQTNNAAFPTDTENQC